MRVSTDPIRVITRTDRLDLGLKLRLHRITGDISVNSIGPNRQLQRLKCSRERLCAPRKFKSLAVDVVQSVIQNLARILPICKSGVLQSSVNIEPEGIGFAIANMSVFDSIGNFVRLACHLFGCAQDGGSAVFDLDHVAEAGAHAEDKNLRGFGEEASNLPSQGLAWIVVPEAGIDGLDIVSSSCDGFEEGSGCICSPCDFPDGASCESRVVFVGLEQSGARVNFVLRGRQSNTVARSVEA
jgi:hypothetical protein